MHKTKLALRKWKKIHSPWLQGYVSQQHMQAGIMRPILGSGLRNAFILTTRGCFIQYAPSTHIPISQIGPLGSAFDCETRKKSPVVMSYVWARLHPLRANISLANFSSAPRSLPDRSGFSRRSRQD